MAYKGKQINKNEDNKQIDIETLIRYKQKGIPLTNAQERALKSAGRTGIVTDIEKTEKARIAAVKFMDTHSSAAIENGYYTELFEEIYKTALAQIFSGREIYLKMPDITPFLALGNFRKNYHKLAEKRQNIVITPSVEKSPLDLEIERQRQNKITLPEHINL